MGVTDSKERQADSEGNSTSRDSEIQPTLLPLGRLVRVHLAPKFYTSEERGFTRSYCLLVTLQREVNVYKASVQHERDLTANVEFHERRRSLREGSLFFGREALSLRRANSVTINSINGSDIEVKQVTVEENDSLRIVGVFKKDLRSTVDLESCDTFDLILCPSSRIRSDCSDWFLLGTMYTKRANSKHARHWRAAVRADYT